MNQTPSVTGQNLRISYFKATNIMERIIVSGNEYIWKFAICIIVFSQQSGEHLISS